MDREKLIEILDSFKSMCAQKERALQEICLEEAFPGDDSSSYILNVRANWVDNMNCSDAIDVLFEILWETTTVEHRKFIFSIQINDSKNNLHCWSDLENSSNGK